jgi:hypothetical protein
VRISVWRRRRRLDGSFSSLSRRSRRDRETQNENNSRRGSCTVHGDPSRDGRGANEMPEVQANPHEELKWLLSATYKAGLSSCAGGAQRLSDQKACNSDSYGLGIRDWGLGIRLRDWRLGPDLIPKPKSLIPYMCPMMASPNCAVLTSVAPSIRRAKS